MRKPVELTLPIGPTTVDDWLSQEHPTDGSRLELILGYLHASPPQSGQHQHAGDELRAVIKNYVVTGVAS